MTSPSDPGLRLVYETALANHRKCMASRAAPFRAYRDGYLGEGAALPPTTIRGAYHAAGAERRRRERSSRRLAWIFRPKTATAGPLDGIVAEPADYERANAILDHVRGCDCSTCELAARLGVAVRQRSS